MVNSCVMLAIMILNYSLTQSPTAQCKAANSKAMFSALRGFGHEAINGSYKALFCRILHQVRLYSLFLCLAS